MLQSVNNNLEFSVKLCVNFRKKINYRLKPKSVDRYLLYCVLRCIDISPQMVVFSVIIFLCQLVFAYLMATITACLTNADAARARFSEKLTNAKLYMEREGLDVRLRHRVVSYYQYLWQRTKGVEPQQLFISLPRSIWGTVSYCLYADLIRFSIYSSFVLIMFA